MARTFKRQRQSHPIAELNVTNLIDLGFTLLIIFMIATPLINQEQTIPVNLPYQSRTAAPKMDKDTKSITITIREQGDYFIDQQNVTFEELCARLKTLGANPNNIVIHVRADGSVAYQKIVSVMDELAKNKLTRLSLATQAGS